MSAGRILIVEDDQGYARSLAAYVVKNGYEARTVGTGWRCFRFSPARLTTAVVESLGI